MAANIIAADSRLAMADRSSSNSSADAEAVLEVDPPQPQVIEDPNVKRNATWADVVWHSITAMVGAGVLGLPHAFSYLGWAGGIIFLAFSLWVSWYTFKQLVEMHEVPDLDSKGGIRRLDRYDQLADFVLGKPRGRRVLLPFQLVMLAGMGVAYTLVGGQSLAAFAAFFMSPQARVPAYVYYIAFGGLQMLLSMLPSMHDVRLVSLLGALMSAAYCTIAVAMCATVRPGADVNYDPAAVNISPLAKTMGVFNAMTTVFFAYGGHNVALEIQATIPVGGRHPLSTVPAMMRGVNWTFLVTGLCYFGVSIMGFYAFGTAVGDNVLLVFKSGPHQWVVAMANMFVVVHVAAAYQVYSQPVFSLAELPFKARNGGAELPLLLQFVLRIAYVVFTTVVALVLPFFSAILGFVGAIAITPTTFLLPPLLWNLYKQPPRWGVAWTVNWALVWVTGVLGVLGCVGSVYIIITSWSSFKLFAQ